MPGLSFVVEGAEAVPFAAAPTITFALRITGTIPGQPVRNIALRCQILIEAARRRYSDTEKPRLRDLFGEPERWGQTLRPLLWTHVNVNVPAFEETIRVEVPVACTFDFNVAATKYFHGVAAGEVPLCFQFSGTVFYSAPDGTLQIAQIDWNLESRYRLPVSIWKQMMDLYYPNSAWLRLRQDVFDRLYRYKMACGVATFEEVLDKLLPVEEAVS